MDSLSFVFIVKVEIYRKLIIKNITIVFHLLFSCSWFIVDKSPKGLINFLNISMFICFLRDRSEDGWMLDSTD